MTNYIRITGRARPRGRLRLIPIMVLAFLLPHSGQAQAPTYETLHSFQGSPDGAGPKGALTIGKNGVLYGTTEAGGTSTLGTVFELTKPTGEPWSETVIHSFSGPDGQRPESTLILSTAGALYGTTTQVAYGGGVDNGTIFELAPPSTVGGAWTETVLYSFIYSTQDPQNVIPNGTLLPGPGGTLYTTTQGSADNPNGGPSLGAVVALVPATATGDAWTEYVLYAFSAPGVSAEPRAGVVSVDGSLYGTDIEGGNFACDCGAVFELTPPPSHGGAWTESTIYSFGETPGDGSSPEAALTVGAGGVLYGTTAFGGSAACGCGTVFQLTPPSAPSGTWTESVIYSFTGSNGDGSGPVASVVVGQNGALYGTTQYGGTASLGTVFELTRPTVTGGAWTETVLHSFTGENGDGATPVAALVMSSTGVLYGTTSGGGTAGKGTVFAVAP
jgi:uncharacterized repeat protein (TIGR03803 family)